MSNGRYFNQQQARGLLEQDDFEPARRFFIELKPELCTEVVLRFRGYTRVLLRHNPDNYGLYFHNPDAPVPFLWLGLGWGANDPPGTLPAWGASFEVNGHYVEDLERGVGELLQRCETACSLDPSLRLHRFEQHVELASWVEFDWLLQQKDQALALTRLWAGYLRTLARAKVPAATIAFASACGIS